MNNRTDILSLRDALSVLREIPGQLIETNVEVDPEAELSGIYRKVGAGGTVMRPTTVDGPAMLFHNVKGHPGASCVIGVLASRHRVATLFGCKKEELGHLVQSCAANPIEPVVVEKIVVSKEEWGLGRSPTHYLIFGEDDKAKVTYSDYSSIEEGDKVYVVYCGDTVLDVFPESEYSYPDYSYHPD